MDLSRSLFIGFFLLLLLTCMNQSYAINASPHSINAMQPDGTKIVLRLKGDERFHWQEDANGYTVLRDKGRYVYAIKGPDGHLVPTAFEVGKASPKANGLQKRTLPSRAIIKQMRASGPGAASESSSAPEQIAPMGSIQNLVIPIRFKNHWDTTNHPATAPRTVPSEANLNVLFNAQCTAATPVNCDQNLVPTGSVRDVYSENSYGQMDLVSEIQTWVDLSNTEQYYANGASADQTLHQALIEALNDVDGDVNFCDYDTDHDGYIDAIAFVHSGYAAEWGGTDVDDTNYTNRIWSHRWVIWDTNGDGDYTVADTEWQSQDNCGSYPAVKVWDYHISPSLWRTSGSDIGRIGVIAHETGHFFGLPDLYDTDADDSGEGIGSYGMMANSWGFDGSQYYPPHFSAWSKINLGWVNPTVIDTAGFYSLQQAESFGEVYRVNNGYPAGEYLLIENRQPVGFDNAMPQGGLAIWHIDDTADYNSQGYPGQQVIPGGAWPDNGMHYRVALLQADGNYDLEHGPYRGDSGDVWHFDGVSEINGSTVPGTDTYQSGVITATGNRIYNISVAGSSMSFDFDNGQAVAIEPPITPTLDTAVYDGVGNVNLAWTDLSDNEDGFKVFRNSDDVCSLSASAGVGVVMNCQDTGVPAGEHTYIVQAFNSGGVADSNVLNVTITLPPIAYASSESTIFGSVAGSYLDTYVFAGFETLTEVESGGKPSKRTSRLEHIWQFNNVGIGLVTTLTVDAIAALNGEGDNFAFSYSVDGGQSYADAFVLTANGISDTMLAELSGVSDTVLVKVIDTNRSRRSRVLDSISVQQMSIGWTDVVDFTPPTNLTATAVSDTQINLAWTDGSGESGYVVRDELHADVRTGIAANTTTTSITGLTPQNTYTYVVCGISSATSELDCSDFATETTLADLGDAPILTSAVGSKVKGRQQVVLSWAYTGTVDIYRTGTSSKTVTGVTATSYLDVIGAKGGATYNYQVCPTGDTINCSSTLTVVF
ncbi:MAG: M6 family metalloprotease domain-containing protein [Colwellia sp.]|nr:M6 family metalloprotease domain-containing protein [Colwellia sp.]